MAEFYEALASVYEDVFPLASAQVGFVTRHLPTPPQQVIDLGCSTGALARELASCGYDVLGVDLATSMIAEANSRTGQMPPSAGRLSFVVADMRQIVAARERVDCLLCLGNTLVHLTDPEELSRFMVSCHRAMRNGGVFIGQIVNYDRVIRESVRELPPLQGQQGNRLRRQYQQRNDGLLDFVTRLTLVNGEQIDSTVALSPLRQQQLHQVLVAAGFEQIAYYGSYQGNEWSEHTFHTIFVARK